MEQVFRTKVPKIKISDKAIELISNPETKRSMAWSLGVSERWISKCVKVNKADGFLTRTTSVSFIKKITGLKKSEILEASEATTTKMAS